MYGNGLYLEIQSQICASCISFKQFCRIWLLTNKWLIKMCQIIPCYCYIGCSLLTVISTLRNEFCKDCIKHCSIEKHRYFHKSFFTGTFELIYSSLHTKTSSCMFQKSLYRSGLNWSRKSTHVLSFYQTCLKKYSTYLNILMILWSPEMMLERLWRPKKNETSYIEETNIFKESS